MLFGKYRACFHTVGRREGKRRLQDYIQEIRRDKTEPWYQRLAVITSYYLLLRPLLLMCRNLRCSKTAAKEASYV